MTLHTKRTTAHIHSEESEMIVNRGVCRANPLTVNYTTRQPAPTQWIAVGVVARAAGVGTHAHVPGMLVGVHGTEDGAVRNLSERLAAIAKRVRPMMGAGLDTAGIARPWLSEGTERPGTEGVSLADIPDERGWATQCDTLFFER
jgi:hypothetical protein